MASCNDFAEQPSVELDCRSRKNQITIASDYQLHLKMSRALIIVLLSVCAVPAVAQAPVTLSIRDHQFVPAEVPVPAGVKVEMIVRNEQAVPAEFESSALHREKIVTPGSAISVYVGPLDPGRYEFFDDFHPASRGFVVVR